MSLLEDVAMADFDTEILISGVEERSYLWDAAHKDYKNRDIRLKGWQEIAASVVRGYEDLQEGEKNKWVTKVQKRWKTARDAYSKSRNKLAQKKSGSGASKIVKYTYHDQMNFLDRVQKGPTDSNFAADEDSQHSTGAQEEDEEDEEESLAGSSLNEPSQQETDGTGNFKRKKRTMNSEFEDSLITLLKDAKDKEDDDRAFLTSLLPSMKSLNPDQKLMFRSQVLHLIMSIKQNSVPAPMPPPFPNAHFNYGPQYGPSTSTPHPANFYPNQNRNYPPYLQGDYHPASTTATPLTSPTPSTVSTSSWGTL